jgi:hypothetical protein
MIVNSRLGQEEWNICNDLSAFFADIQLVNRLAFTGVSRLHLQWFNPSASEQNEKILNEIKAQPARIDNEPLMR